MFIFNLTKDELVYRAHGEVIKLKRGLNLINNCITSAKELKAHFGDFIKFIEDEVIPAKKEEKAEVKVEEAKNEEIVIEDENPAELEEACEECVLQPAEEVKAEEVKVEETKPAKKSTKKSNKKNK